ncbi:MAG TPA: YggS family pyridoxal phosphate-dependent enzyme [Longimicrobiales bacterium]|nr:YggS family pyridoxal phosphate-dependent enzyme [Longimicrobiales bacterium]
MDTLELGAKYAERLAVSLPLVRQRIHEAAASAGRDPASVRLVAVTKGHPIEAVRAAMARGLSDFGENRVEELEEKVRVMGVHRATWHMIGHVQSRKAPRAVQAADLIHSVDSVSLAERISRAAGSGDRVVRILAQVNTSGEASKSGFQAEAAVEGVLRMAALPNLKVEGLMTMAPLVDDEEVLASAFRRLRETLEVVRGRDPRVGPELSMGMTNDLEIAVRGGSTMVRIGTALFGERGTL